MITLIATLTGKPENADELKTELLNLVENTTKESGCIQYKLHQEVDNPHMFRFYEQFKSQEAFDFHSNQPYIKAMGEKAHLFEKPTVLTFLEVLS